MKAHICIGGPLDGYFATSEDFAGAPYKYSYPNGRTNPPMRTITGDAGMYNHLRDEYAQYNFGNSPYGSSFIPRARPSMVWLHYTLLKPSIPPSRR